MGRRQVQTFSHTQPEEKQMRIWVRFWASCKSAAAEALVLGVSIINKSQANPGFLSSPFPLSSHLLQLWVIPQLWSPFLNRRHLGGCSPGSWLATLAALWVLAAWGEMLLQGVSGLCSCDEAREKQGGGGGSKEVAFFFFPFLLRSLPRARLLHSQTGRVGRRSGRGRSSWDLGTHGFFGSVPRPCDLEKA